MNIGRSFSFNTFSSIFTLLFTLVITLLTKVLLSRILSIDDFGVFIQAQTLFTLLVFIISLNLTDAVVRNLSQNRKLFKSSFLVSIKASLYALTIILLLLVLTSLFSLDSYLFPNFGISMILIIIFFSFAKVITDLFGAAAQGFQAIYLKNFRNDFLPNLIFFLVLSIFLAILNLGNKPLFISFESILFIYLFVISFPFLIYTKPVSLTSLFNSSANEGTSFKSMWSFASPLFLSGIIAWPLALMPIFIGVISTNELVAIYSLSISLSSLIYLSTSAIDLSGFSFWTERLKKDSIEEVNLSFKKYVFYSALFSSSILAILILCPKEVVLFLFGHEFLSVSILLPYFALTFFFNLLCGPLEGLLKADSQSKIILIARIGSGISAIISFYPLITNLGSLGAFFVFLLSTLVGKSIYLFFSVKRLGITPISKDLIILSLSITAAISLSYFFKIHIESNSSFIIILLSLVVFNVALLLISYLLGLRLISNWIDFIKALANR